MALIRCAYCRRKVEKPNSAINRAARIGAPLYCSQWCAGFARRANKSKAQKVAEKAAYDQEYRRLNLARIKRQKAEHFQRTYDPVAAAVARKATMPRHVEYCRQPAYKKWKAEYDRRYRAGAYGDFAEAYLLTVELNREIKSRSSNYEIRRQNNTGNKAQERDRSSEGPKRDDSDSSANGQ